MSQRKICVSLLRFETSKYLIPISECQITALSFLIIWWLTQMNKNRLMICRKCPNYEKSYSFLKKAPNDNIVSSFYIVAGYAPDVCCLIADERRYSKYYWQGEPFVVWQTNFKPPKECPYYLEHLVDGEWFYL